MEKFSLLVDGKDLDSGRYEYFPYADKVITSFKDTYKRMLAIKKEKTSFNDIEKYVYAKYVIGTEETNQMAITAAYKASKEYRSFPVSIRRKILGDIHKYLLEEKENLINLFVCEGHPRKLAEWEFLGMEKAYRPESLNYFKNELWTELGVGGNETMYLARKPDGVVCVSPPKNAPCSNSLTAGFALLGGNTVVLKPPLRTPLSTIYLWKNVVWRAAKENGAPNGTVNIVLGNSKKIMDEWIESPFVNDIVFFGTSERGLEIGHRIYSAGKKPILELSGNDFLAIWKDADVAGAVEALSDAFLGSTQICMVPKAALIHSDIFEDFTHKFLEKVRKMKVGLPSDPATYFTPVLKINEFYDFLDDACAKDAEVLFGGKRIDHDGSVSELGQYLMPTVVSLKFCDDIWKIKCIKEENFFPLIPLVKIEGEDEDVYRSMVDMINANDYGLRASVWVKSSFYVRKFIRDIHNTGLLRINSRHVDFSLYLSTHGGTGRTGGPFGEMNYIWQKTTHLQGISLTRDNI